jgi:hypothetical protein
MKFFLLFFTLLLLFSGCSKKNAFFAFKMDRTKELSAASLQSSKIVSKEGEVRGVLSSIYLNEVYPESFNGYEYFIVFLYLKETKELYNPNTTSQSDLKLTMNSQLPIKVEKLPKENQFSHLIDRRNDWNDCYIVAFEQAESMNLSIEDNQSSSAVILKYTKDK